MSKKKSVTKIVKQQDSDRMKVKRVHQLSEEDKKKAAKWAQNG